MDCCKNPLRFGWRRVELRCPFISRMRRIHVMQTLAWFEDSYTRLCLLYGSPCANNTDFCSQHHHTQFLPDFSASYACNTLAIGISTSVSLSDDSVHHPCNAPPHSSNIHLFVWKDTVSPISFAICTNSRPTPVAHSRLQHFLRPRYAKLVRAHDRSMVGRLSTILVPRHGRSRGPRIAHRHPIRRNRIKGTRRRLRRLSIRSPHRIRERIRCGSSLVLHLVCRRQLDAHDGHALWLRVDVLALPHRHWLQYAQDECRRVEWRRLDLELQYLAMHRRLVWCGIQVDEHWLTIVRRLDLIELELY